MDLVFSRVSNTTYNHNFLEEKPETVSTESKTSQESKISEENKIKPEETTPKPAFEIIFKEQKLGSESEEDKNRKAKEEADKRKQIEMDMKKWQKEQVCLFFS